MKPDTVYKQAHNAMLDWLRDSKKGDPIPSENELRKRFGVSRTTVRKVIAGLVERGFLREDGNERRVGNKVRRDAYFAQAETVATSEQVESQFMEWILRGDARPGMLINELELARTFGVGTTGIREFLNQFRRFGLIEKRPNAGWLFKGFTPEFAAELFEIRELFERRSAATFATLPQDSPIWVSLRALRQEHVDLLADIDARYRDFSDLDNRFHRLVNAAAPNRFIDDFYDIISLIFHYHYQWNKQDERERNEVAITEHLAYIDALLKRDAKKIDAACRLHLASARKTLNSAFAAAH